MNDYTKTRFIKCVDAPIHDVHRDIRAFTGEEVFQGSYFVGKDKAKDFPLHYLDLVPTPNPTYYRIGFGIAINRTFCNTTTDLFLQRIDNQTIVYIDYSNKNSQDFYAFMSESAGGYMYLPCKAYLDSFYNELIGKISNFLGQRYAICETQVFTDLIQDTSDRSTVCQFSIDSNYTRFSKYIDSEIPYNEIAFAEGKIGIHPRKTFNESESALSVSLGTYIPEDGLVQDIGHVIAFKIVGHKENKSFVKAWCKYPKYLKAYFAEALQKVAIGYPEAEKDISRYIEKLQNNPPESSPVKQGDLIRLAPLPTTIVNIVNNHNGTVTIGDNNTSAGSNSISVGGKIEGDANIDTNE